MNNAENLDDLLAIEKQLRIKDEQIEQIQKELNDTKINNENLVENMKKNFNEKSEIFEAKKGQEKSEYENIINKKDEEIKKLENDKKEMGKDIQRMELKIKFANDKLSKYEKIEKEKATQNNKEQQGFIE